jgi:hypothetical protein
MGLVLQESFFFDFIERNSKGRSETMARRSELWFGRCRSRDKEMGHCRVKAAMTVSATPSSG